MRMFKHNLIPRYPQCVLLTADGIGEGYDICIADFRDIKALYYPKSGNFVGSDEFGRMWLLTNNIHMVDGIWISTVDDTKEMIKDIQATLLTLETIK